MQESVALAIEISVPTSVYLCELCARHPLPLLLELAEKIAVIEAADGIDIKRVASLV